MEAEEQIDKTGESMETEGTEQAEEVEQAVEETVESFTGLCMSVTGNKLPP